MEIWQTPAGKRRYKIAIDTPWVDFSRDSVIKRIVEVSEMLSEPVDDGMGTVEDTSGAHSTKIIKWLEEDNDRAITIPQAVQLLGIARTRARSVLEAMVNSGTLITTRASGRGQRNQYSLNHNRTQSVPRPQGTVDSDVRIDESDFE